MTSRSLAQVLRETHNFSRPSTTTLVHLVALLILSGWYVNLFSEWLVNFDKPDRRIDLGPQSTMIATPRHEWTLDDMINGEGRILLEREGRPFHNVAITHDTLWIRMDLAREQFSHSGTQEWFLEFERANLDRVEFHVVDRDSNGALHPSMHRIREAYNGVDAADVSHVNAVFRVTVDPQHPPVIYLRINNMNAMDGALTLWDPNLFLRKVAVEETVYGIFSGGVLALLLYNACMYAVMRQRVYLYYMGYVFLASLGWMMSEGHIQILFDALNPYYMKWCLPFFMQTTVAMCYLFTAEFLETRNNHPRIHSFLVGVAGILLMLCAINPLLDFSVADESWLLLSSLLIPVLLVIGTYALKQGNENALFFLIAWIFNVGGGCIFLLMEMGVWEQNLFTRTTFPAGILIEAILLSFSLADKIKRAQREVDSANEQALALANRYSAALEGKVQDRTRHLEASQQELVVKQQQAAMGVLTAGIAHEINNPNNFVSAGLQNLNAWRVSFEQLIDDLLDEGSDPAIRDMFRLKFATLAHSLAGIDTASDNISGIVTGLRTITRLDEADKKDVDIIDGLLQTLRFMIPSIGSGIEFITALHDRPQVFCHAADMNAAFMNLVTNAVQAVRDREETHEPGYHGKIQIESRVIHEHDTRRLELTISDNGCGMTQGVLARAFEPFFTTRSAGAGAGLGLGIARDTIERHDGSITLKSSEAEGSKVCVTLPLQ